MFSTPQNAKAALFPEVVKEFVQLIEATAFNQEPPDHPPAVQSLGPVVYISTLCGKFIQRLRLRFVPLSSLFLGAGVLSRGLASL